ncbi:lipopolysaccharide biosynthesis protein [Parachlamydia acanthamoebae]|uniref:lipopolysaccharide biosynthesis protein n=1 Tax=Parachlamydia acanthamoebae TaxID=83552 RepID=UPI00075080C9|nr:oligosaccharide flippase family protein [Parachlamydia acanthamoebae]
MHLSRLFRGTFIYGLGQFLARAVTFFLLPLYTSYLSPADYGVFGSLAVLGMMMNGLLTLGFGGSLTRTYWTLEKEEDKGALIWTGFLTLLFNACLWDSFAYLFSDQLSIWLFGVSDYAWPVFLSFFGISLSATLYPLLSYFRIREKAVLSITLYLSEVFVSIGATLFFVVFKGDGALGLVKGALSAQAWAFFITFSVALRQIPLGVHVKYLRELILVGYPFILGLFGYFLLQSSARYILHLYTDLKVVGLFCVGLYFARPVELAVNSFNTAWQPFFSSYLYQQEEAKVLFGKVMSYYLMGMCLLIAPLFTMAKALTYYMLHPAYHQTWSTIGLLGVSQSLWGAYVISAAPFLFHKKSIWRVSVETLAGLVCVGMNFALIPSLGKEGGALATFFGFVAVIVLSIWATRRLLKVQYEVGRLLKMLCGFCVTAIASFIPIDFGLQYLSLMFFVTFLYYAFLWKICLTLDEKTLIISKIRGLVGLQHNLTVTNQ